MSLPTLEEVTLLRQIFFFFFSFTNAEHAHAHYHHAVCQPSASQADNHYYPICWCWAFADNVGKMCFKWTCFLHGEAEGNDLSDAFILLLVLYSNTVRACWLWLHCFFSKPHMLGTDKFDATLPHFSSVQSHYAVCANLIVSVVGCNLHCDKVIGNCDISL